MAGLPVITDDGSVWPEDQQPAPASAPPDTSPYWIPRILSNLWQTAKSGINLTGDIAQGNASMADPETQKRVGDMASTALMLPALASAPEGALMAGARRPNAAQIAAIQARAAELKKGAWPQTKDTIFDTSPEAYARTTDIVPQSSVRDVIPGPSPDYPLPKGGRAAPITDASKGIASAIAERLYPWVQSQDPRLMFYNTGPIYETLEKQGIDPAAIMKEWAGQVAATSPRTETPPNLRNASYLLFRRGEGQTPFSESLFDTEGNPLGYGMMGKQVASAERFGSGQENPLTAPKQFTFRGNVQGNLASPTIDTHNIRSSLYQFDQIYPGKVPREWFTSDEAYNAYRANGGFTPNAQIARSAIDDSLGSITRGGVKKQVEFGPMTTPWYDAATELGIAPAQAQAGGWFNYGGVTGLRSPVRSMSQLFSDQIYDTARTLGVEPERVLDWWSKKLIPLTQNEASPMQTQVG
jgi:hypothetical protein